MCGAFSVLHPFRDLSQRFNAGYNESWEKPRFNIRPSQPIPIITNTNPKDLVFSSWGIHPHYDKTNKMFFINARNNSLQKPTWRKMLAEQRCLIPADGFYEWKKMDTKVKVPYRFEMKNKELFAFAGLWQLEKNKEGREIIHSVIITTEPNKTVGSIHDRMPAILKPDEERKWLDVEAETEQLQKLLTPFSDKEMRSYAISTLVNSPKNDTPEVILPAQNST